MALYGHFVFLVFKISALFTKNPSIPYKCTMMAIGLSGGHSS